MPACLIFHERDALALDGLRKDHGRLALDGRRFREGSLDAVEIMAVDRNDVAAERFELLVLRFGRHDVRRLAVDLEAVDVDDGAEVVEFILRGRHHCFPYLAFRDLAVAEDRVDTVILFVDLLRIFYHLS